MRNINQKYKRQKNKSRYIIVLRNTFQQKCQYAKSFQRKKMSNWDSSSSEDEGNPNSSEGLHDTEVGIGDDVLTTSHLFLSILFRRRWLTWTPALMMTTMATAQPAATAQALRRFSSFSSTKRPASPCPIANWFTIISPWLSGWGGGCVAWRALALWGGRHRRPTGCLPQNFSSMKLVNSALSDCVCNW